MVMKPVLQRIPYSASSQRTNTGSGRPFLSMTEIGMQQYHQAAYMLSFCHLVGVYISL